jgi:hypothetical protein
MFDDERRRAAPIHLKGVMRVAAGGRTMRRMIPSHRFLTALVLLAVAVAGCGDDGGGDDGGSAGTASTASATPRTVSTAAVEEDIQRELSTADGDVQCPKEVSAASGTRFTCSATWPSGAVGEVRVTAQTATSYSYEPVPGSVKIPGATVEQTLEQELAAQGTSASVTCPDTIIVKVGTTATCDAMGSGGKVTGSVTFSFSNLDGTVNASSVQSTSA